jgi:transcriptional antiterminator RfaH
MMSTAGSARDAGSILQPIDGERWYVAYTPPHKEAMAVTHLGEQGFRTFLPRQLKNVRHARKVRTILAPVFPRYLFVILNLDRDRWLSVNGTRGITRLIMVSGRPVPVPWCRRIVCWNWVEAVSSGLRLSDHAARSMI